MKAANPLRRWARHSTNGSVAVELAILLTAFFFIFFGVFFFGQIFSQYHAVKNATASAARYLARGSPAEIKSVTRRDAAVALVRTLAAQNGVAQVTPTIVCSPSLSCQGSVTAITAQADVVFNDPTMRWLSDSLTISASSTVSYPN
jgi:Flp pilus assembly protein TadG